MGLFSISLSIDMTQYELDCQRISQISFDETLTQKEKNTLISRIEKRMERMENLENSGKNTGYYN